MFVMKFSMEKPIFFFGLLDFFLPAINATVFTMLNSLEFMQDGRW
jgi:hypothetical protein